MSSRFSPLKLYPIARMERGDKDRISEISPDYHLLNAGYLNSTGHLRCILAFNAPRLMGYSADLQMFFPTHRAPVYDKNWAPRAPATLQLFTTTARFFSGVLATE